MPTYGPPPLVFVRGEGTRLWDPTAGSTSTSCPASRSRRLGHAHPAVADALADAGQHAAARVEPVRHRARLARWPATLDRLLGGGGQVFFANSGAEANECAIKLARQVRADAAATSVVERATARSTAARSPRSHATGQPPKHETFQPLPEGFRQVAWRRPRRARGARSTRRSPRCCSSRCRARAASTRPPPSTSQGVRRLCDERGVLLIVDEVQTGLGRTGAWFGFQHVGVVPDVVTMAKALGNGVPIGACWARAEVAAAFEPGDHATTFGGQPLATAAARAVLA